MGYNSWNISFYNSFDFFIASPFQVSIYLQLLLQVGAIDWYNCEPLELMCNK